MAWRTIAVFAALATLAVPAGAGELFTYADERCRNAQANGVVCTASTEEMALIDIIGKAMSFEKFLKENRNLENGVTPDTVIPPFTLFVTGTNT